MPTFRVGIAVIALAAILLIGRVARPSCQDGLSEGYAECQQHPGCECAAVTKTCPNGGWYTQYSVDLTKCVGSGSATPTPTSNTPPQPTPTPAPPRRKKTPCEMMQQWLEEEKKILAGYQNDGFLDQAMRQGWSPGQYDEGLWRAIHPGVDLPESGDAVMWTNPRTCKIENYDAGCKWLQQQGLPPIACKIALDHEKVHVEQCRHRPRGYSPGDLRQRRDREVAAHKQTISEIEQALPGICGPVALR